MKKKNLKTIGKTLLLSTLVAGVSASYARGMPFAAMDTDKSGTVSEQEFNTAKAKHIEAREAEGRQMRGLGNAPIFADFDADKNGELTLAEVQVVQQARMQTRPGKGMRGMGMRRNQPSFADFDANGDDSITKQEFYDARNKRIAERAKQRYMMRGLANAPAFEDVDTNNDGKVNQDEFMLQQQQHRPVQK